MGSFNKIILMGNLTRDCETRFANNGTAIVKFGLAVNRRFQDADGNWKEQPTFVDVTIFGKRGEAFARFHTKGKQALIEGQLRMDTWDDKQTGQKRSKLYVVADSWEFSGPSGREAGGGGGGGAPANYEGGGEPTVDAPSPAAVDETPF
jgi:single-strand DNA-binding protein